MTATSQLLDAIRPRLEQITVANGYPFTLRPGSILRSKPVPFSATPILPAACYWSNGQEVTERQYARERRRLEVTVEARDLTHDHPFVDVASRLGEVIETALTRAIEAPTPEDDPSFYVEGDLGEIQIADILYSIGEGQSPWCAVMVTASIFFTVAAGRPNTIILL